MKSKQVVYKKTALQKTEDRLTAQGWRIIAWYPKRRIIMYLPETNRYKTILKNGSVKEGKHEL